MLVALWRRKRYRGEGYGCEETAGTANAIHARVIRNDLANVRLGLRRLSRVSHFETLVKRLVEHCAHLSPDPAWPEIGKLDLEGDAENLKTWIEKILITEPPSANIAASWFGIFDLLGPDGRASSSLYMAGAETYDPGDDGSWACSPVYFPEHRYAESAVLRSISGLLAGRDNGVSWLGSYMLLLAYAALAVKKAERSSGRYLASRPRCKGSRCWFRFQ